MSSLCAGSGSGSSSWQQHFGRPWKAFPKPGSCSPFDFPFWTTSCSWSRLSSLIKSSKGKQEPGTLSQCIFPQWKRLHWHVKLVTDCSRRAFPSWNGNEGSCFRNKQGHWPYSGFHWKNSVSNKKVGNQVLSWAQSSPSKRWRQNCRENPEIKVNVHQSKAHQSSDKK